MCRAARNKGAIIARAFLAVMLLNPIIRYVLLSVGVVGVMGFIYLKGRIDCASKWRDKLAAAEQEWNERTLGAVEKAANDAVERERARSKIKDAINDMANEAENEVVEDDVCVSAGTLERLRNIN